MYKIPKLVLGVHPTILVPVLKREFPYSPAFCLCGCDMMSVGFFFFNIPVFGLFSFVDSLNIYILSA